MKRVAVFGASGAIGHALGQGLLNRFPDCDLFAAARAQTGGFETSLAQSVEAHIGLDLERYDSIAEACERMIEGGMPEIILIATGLLHGAGFSPERSFRELNGDHFAHVLAVNLIGPSLVLKHIMPHIPRSGAGAFRIGLLSARVGSISDNRLGGWHSYRASKAGLNMVIKGAAIELARRNRDAVLIGLHPGTVDSELSAPFQTRVSQEKLFSPKHSASCLLNVLLSRGPEQSGACFDWAGEEIEP